MWWSDGIPLQGATGPRRSTASRLLAHKLVSTEVAYIQRELGASATQEALDAKVLAVRSMPWSSIVLAD